MSPALAGRFLTTVPPGKSKFHLLKRKSLPKCSDLLLSGPWTSHPPGLLRSYCLGVSFNITLRTPLPVSCFRSLASSIQCHPLPWSSLSFWRSMLPFVSWESKGFFSFRNHFLENFKGTAPFFSVLQSPCWKVSFILILTLCVTTYFPSGSFSLTLMFCKFTMMWLGPLLDFFLNSFVWWLPLLGVFCSFSNSC